MELKNFVFLMVGLVAGCLITYLLIGSDKRQDNNEKMKALADWGSNNPDFPEYNNSSSDCSSIDVTISMMDYIEFYVNNDDFYVLPDPKIRYQGDCEWHVKIIRQSKQFSDVQHTNFIKCTAIGDELRWDSMN